jgi:hypothetical protein
MITIQDHQKSDGLNHAWLSDGVGNDDGPCHKLRGR